jgi:hypothetical protein
LPVYVTKLSPIEKKTFTEILATVFFFAQVQSQHFALKKDRNNILLQTMDASQKFAEQMRQAKEITKNLDEMVIIRN